MKIKAKYIAEYESNGIKIAQFVNEFSDVFKVKRDFVGCDLVKDSYYLIEVEPRYWENKKDNSILAFFGFKVITRL